MKKKLIWIPIILLAIFLFIFSLNYYKNNYALDNTYYILVSEDVDFELEDLYDSDGNVADTGKEYQFVGYDKEGNAKELSFTIRTEDPDKLLQPGRYLQIETSQVHVLSETYIDEDKVPQKALDRLIEKE